jgi:DNA invertase Pin-like site-specific DNA recombinase
VADAMDGQGLPVAAALANRHPERTVFTLLEFCGLVGTLDEDGIYDPRHPNDRLLLGMKVTMSEMKLSLFRHRSLEPLKQKARRGELFLTLAIGYLKTSHDRIEKDPDRRVQEAIALVFVKFAELQTVR